MEGQAVANRSQLDAASMKRVDGGVYIGSPPVNLRNPGRVRFRQVSLEYLVRWAYNVQPYQALGPEWWHSVFYDVEAIFPAGTPLDRLREMMRALLDERLQMKTHREMKETPVYVVGIAKGGNTRQDRDCGIDSHFPRLFARPGSCYALVLWQNDG